jgi:hypothetical protein
MTGLGNSAPPQAAKPEQPETPKPLPKKHTSVVYFHGMGSQRRYEEISRLIDCLDKYAYRHQEEVGRLAEIKTRLEPPRGACKKDVAYIEAVRLFERPAPRVRFYEAYWAPLTAGGVPSLQVLRWLLKQLPHPLTALRTPWRLRARLRRASLHALWSKLSTGRQAALFSHDDFISLLIRYDEFEGPNAWRNFPNGDFRQFLSFLAQGKDKSVEGADDKANIGAKKAGIINLARKWHRFYITRELLYAFVLLTLGLTALLAVALVGSVVVLLMKLLASKLGSDLLSSANTLLAPTTRNVTSVLLALASLLGINRFLRDFLGDVQVWATYEETDEKYQKRSEILEASQDLLKHVLLDESCDRIVVVAHSLGTTVALDSLLQLGRYNRAHAADALPLEKFDQFITMGSPVDKVHYFFESEQGKYHRYNRVVEEIRGDIGTTPFAKNRKPHIHWINFWDRADVVSDPLETPTNRTLVSLVVDNVEVSSLGFPMPAQSHSAYFRYDPVLKVLFEVIFLAKYSFLNAKLIPDKGYDYKAEMLGPGVGLRRTLLYHVVALAIPWIVALTALFWLLKLATAVEASSEVLLGSISVLVLGWLWGRPWRIRSFPETLSRNVEAQ